MPTAGSLSDYIVIEERVLTLLGNGQKTESWANPVKWPAAVERRTEQACKFTIRYRPDIRPHTHRIIFFDAIWTITDAVSDARHSETVIDSDFSQLREATPFEATEQEYITGLPLIRPPGT